MSGTFISELHESMFYYSNAIIHVIMGEGHINIKDLFVSFY